ncbi:hypothetical protein [Hydrogenophaga sp.]|uniref:hypothetical protein n=1 Tax=Hydrogenophaga sp. TaxID=1904254 RepID=UPI003AF7A98C
MIKTWVSMFTLGLAALSFTAAQADGVAKAKHGGVVQKANDITYELVANVDGAALHIDDHGKPVSVVGASGKLTVLSGADKSEAELKPAGDKLEAQGIKLPAGSKVVASVTTADKKTVSVRFTVK